MASYRRYVRMTIALGVLTVVALCFSYLALDDIAHREFDLSMEWAVLRVTVLIILMFVAMSLVTLRRVLKMQS